MASNDLARLQGLVPPGLDEQKLRTGMREPTAMSKAIFQILAGFTLAFDTLLFFGGIFTIVRYPPHSYWEIVPGMAFVGVLAVAALGLFRLRKWAALVVSGLALYAAFWGVKDALHPIPGYANWVGYVFAVLLAIPAIVTVVYWRTLVWRGKP